MHCLRDSRLGIIGSGSLGQAVAKLGEAFGMDVCFAQRKFDKRKEEKNPSQQSQQKSSQNNKQNCPDSCHSPSWSAFL